MARLVFEGSVDTVVCCFRPRQAYRRADSNQHPREALQ